MGFAIAAMDKGSEEKDAIEPSDRKVKAARPRKARTKAPEQDRKAKSAPAVPREPRPEAVEEDDWNGPVPSFLGQGLVS
jgi:hypothetical protein